MPRETLRLPLLTPSPGTRRELIVHRYGQAGNGKKAYMHAALHSDETPGLLVLHHLVRLLDEAESQGLIQGEIVIVPFANPIGLGQFVNGDHNGRYEMGGGGNFNRNWPDLYAELPDAVEGKLTDDPQANVGVIRAALRAALDSVEPDTEFGSLRRILARLAVDADLVLDIHCDDEALLHLFLIPAHWPLASDLAADLGARAVLLSDDSGGNSFDESFSTPWTRLQRHFTNHPIPAACLSATVELRGKPDVSDELAEEDAKSLFRYLQRQGYLGGTPDPLPKALCEATDLAATDTVRAPGVGVLSYTVPLGANVKTGDLVAWLIDPAAEDPGKGRVPVRCATDGLVLSRRINKYVPPGHTVVKVVGREALDYRKSGHLLED